MGHDGDLGVPERGLPHAGLLPKDRAQRARCRSICGEMHSGFSTLRSALPMNLKPAIPIQGVVPRAGRHRAHHDDLERVPRGERRAFPVWQIMRGRSRCTRRSPRASTRTMSGSMRYRPLTARIMALPEMQEWIAAASSSPTTSTSSKPSFSGPRRRLDKLLLGLGARRLDDLGHFCDFGAHVLREFSRRHICASMPCLKSWSFTSGFDSALTISALSRVTMSFETLAGACSPYQVSNS